MENTSKAGQSASSAAGASGTMSEQEMNEALTAMADDTAGSSGSSGTGSASRMADNLRTELASLKSNLDALLSRAPGMSAEELSQAQARLIAQFGSLKHAARGVANEASRQFNRGVETTSVYVKDKPMQSVAVAVGAGLLLGMLLKRR